MWNKLICVFFLYWISIQYSTEALWPQARSPEMLKTLDSNLSLPVDEKETIDLDEDFGLENINLIEGDIIPDEIDITDRSSVIKKSKLWPRGRISYVISPKLSDHKIDIRNAMKYIENVTCLRFLPRIREKNYVRIFKGDGCNSRIGMSGGVQDISLGPGCYQRGKIMHELLHAAGFYHEHSRSDRDNYIYVHWENIQRGHEINFVKNKPGDERLITPYDYQSIMHYSTYSFSKDKSRGLKTMTAKKRGVVLKSPGVKVLSRSDIKRVSVLYNCPEPRPYTFPRFPRFSLSRLFSYIG